MKINYLAIGAAVLTAISVFMPWIGVSMSTSIGGFNSSFQSQGVAGTHFGDAIIGLLIALGGGFMAFKNIKWSFIAGVINFLIGIAHMFGWIGESGGFNSAYAEASIKPQYGLYIFVIASVLFVIATIKYLKIQKTE
ncbi:MAG: hypothetical protein WCL51_17720 [Bacteroidota bacterium]